MSRVTVREALAGAVSEIAAAGCPTPRLDAELLLAHALGLERERLLCDASTTVGDGALPAFRRSVRRRAGEREAVAYITGQRAFRNLTLVVDRRALIPRPETELLVEVALALPGRARVLEVGTGSGAVALEVGAGQARAVAARTRAAGFRDVRCERDLAGVERVVVGQRRRR